MWGQRTVCLIWSSAYLGPLREWYWHKFSSPSMHQISCTAYQTATFRSSLMTQKCALMCVNQGTWLQESSAVALAIFVDLVCWGSSISSADKKRINKLIKKADSVLGHHLDPVHVMVDRRMLGKLASMLKLPPHPWDNGRNWKAPSVSGCFTLRESYHRPVLPSVTGAYYSHNILHIYFKIFLYWVTNYLFVVLWIYKIK